MIWKGEDKQTYFLGWEVKLEWYDLKKIVTFWRKKKEISFERYDNKISHFCHYFGISQRKPNCFWEIWGGRICKKNWGIDWWLIQKFLNNIALGSIKKCWLSQRFGGGRVCNGNLHQKIGVKFCKVYLKKIFFLCKESLCLL